jgi:hypothetical protein
MRYVRSILIVLAAVALVPTFSSAAEVLTLHLPETTESFNLNNPCLGRISGTMTYTGVLLLTENGNGFHAVIEIHGDATVVPANPSLDAFEGHFAEIQVENLNPNASVDTFVVTQLGAGGRSFHITFHVVADPSGAIRVEVFNVSCG